MEKIGLLYHYIIPNLIVISLSLLMIKKWGITSGATFVSACLLYICLFILKDKNHYSVFFILIFNFFLFIFMEFYILTFFVCPLHVAVIVAVPPFSVLEVTTPLLTVATLSLLLVHEILP